MAWQGWKWLAGYAAALVASSAFVLGLQGKGPHKPAVGTIKTFAQAPAVPGFYEGVAIDGNSVFVSGPARFGTAGTGPSVIQVFDRKSGELESTITVQGEFLEFEHALSNVAVDGDGRVYALSTQLGVVRFTKVCHQWVQDSYGAPIPDLPTAVDAAPGEPSSPTQFDLPPIVNDLVFDQDGYLYVSDSLQATIFRYPPGGGAPEIWFQSPLFDGTGFIPFGPNGLRIDPSREHLYCAISTSASLGGAGIVVRLPLANAPTEDDLEIFHVYVPGEIPDQLAFATDGTLFVSLALSNRIGVLAPNGTEIASFTSHPGDAIPLDAPAAIAFDARTKSLLITNHALLTGDATHFAVLSLYVGDAGDPLEKP